VTAAKNFVLLILFSPLFIYAQESEQPDTTLLKARVSDNIFKGSLGLLPLFYDRNITTYFINLSYRHSKLSHDYIEKNFGHGFSL